MTWKPDLTIHLQTSYDAVTQSLPDAVEIVIENSSFNYKKYKAIKKYQSENYILS